MNNSCYAMVLEGPKKFIKKEFPIPQIGDEDLLLKIEMVSICGSDRHLFTGHHRLSSFPKILGHEIVGFVEKAGKSALKNYNVKIGDRVTVEPYISCTKCKFCLTGNYQAHIPHSNYGVGIDCAEPPYLWGGYSEYMYVAPGSKVFKINSDVPAKAACLSSVIGNGVRWARTKGNVRCGESVAIVGSGAQGLAAVVAAKELGAYPIIVIGLTKDSVKFELAKELGADYCINLETSDPIEEIKRITNGDMVDVAIECAGAIPTVKLVFQLPKVCGRVVLSGLTGGREVSMVTDRIVNDELIVRGGHGQSWDVGDAADIINSRKYPIEKMITHVFPLTEVSKAMDLFFEAPAECIRIGLVP